jgi:hypothetical protein
MTIHGNQCAFSLLDTSIIKMLSSLRQRVGMKSSSMQPYHRTNESPGWYLVLTSRSLIKVVTGDLTANQSVEILPRDAYEIVILLIGNCVV